MAWPRKLPGTKRKKRKPAKAKWKGKTYIARTAKMPDYAMPPSFDYTQTGEVCADSKGKLERGVPYPQLVFREGQPFVRFCEQPRKPGPLLPVRDPVSANRQAKRAIAPFPRERRYDLPPGLEVGRTPRALGKADKPKWVRCRSVGKMTAAKEKKLPDSAFGIVSRKGGKKVRKYPMPDPKHAINAKGRARQQLEKKNITKRQYDAIVRKANRVIAACKRG